MLTLRERLDQLRGAHPFFRAWVPALSAAYLLLVVVMGGPATEHFLIVGIALAFSLWSDSSRKYARVVLPYLLYAMVYDSMRWYEDYIRSPIVHAHEPYDFDLRFFGIHGLTPNEWLQRHTTAALDLVCGLAYTPFFFIGESVLLSLYFVWKGDATRAIRFTWIFFVANVLGFSCYYIYPAAPPWYVADHGFAIDLSVRASPAGAIRFDQLVGFPLMQSFYGKSADVFGAIPSLHVVYPFLATIYGWMLPRFRKVAVPYFFLVCFSAVYLNHHYLLDLFTGLGLALVVMAAVRVRYGALVQEREGESVAPALAEPLRN